MVALAFDASVRRVSEEGGGALRRFSYTLFIFFFVHHCPFTTFASAFVLVPVPCPAARSGRAFFFVVLEAHIKIACEA